MRIISHSSTLSSSTPFSDTALTFRASTDAQIHSNKFIPHGNPWKFVLVSFHRVESRLPVFRVPNSQIRRSTASIAGNDYSQSFPFPLTNVFMGVRLATRYTGHEAQYFLGQSRLFPTSDTFASTKGIRID